MTKQGEEEENPLVYETLKEPTHGAFVAAYCRDTGMTVRFFHLNYSALPCNCGDPWCEGWVVLTEELELLRTYRDAYLKRLH